MTAPLACRCGHAVTYHEPACYATVAADYFCACVGYVAHYHVGDGGCRCGSPWRGPGRCDDA